VEDIRQLALLKLAGCDYVQGYALAYPVPETELFDVLDRLDADDLGNFPERLSA
jgi:EAL domain-containing protein (putative c-di-GMP-specific phosphodiesterase class I)